MSGSNDDPLLIESDEGVLTQSVDDAPRNRMTFEYMDALEQAVADAADDPAVRVLVITAAGEENFSVGMDLKQLMSEELGALEDAPSAMSRTRKHFVGGHLGLGGG
jgi:enoyl-CoA hydratase/carnithine racemase